MDADKIKAIEPLLDQIAEIVEQQLASADIRRVLAAVSDALGEGHSANISVVVDVFNGNRKRSLPLLSTGLTAFPGQDPFPTWGDSSWQRYVVKDGIVCVPHDRCPGCWQTWELKLHNATCPCCGLSMGEQCQLLIDNDECPWCNEGTVTVANPRCDRCDYEVDRSKVAWG